MSTLLGNGTITFGDGTVQSTATPANVSAFTNDSGYTTKSNLDPVYSTIAAAGAGFAWGGSVMAVQLQWYNIAGTQIGSASFNCNCNC